MAFAILLFGFGAAALVQAVGTADGWSVRADVGDSFGVVNAIVSGLALTALIITLRMQSRELAMQRAELAMQREALNQSRVELNRAAEANLRMLHVDLIRMAIDDQSLAAVWPPLVPGEPHEKERQYLYANLIYLHIWMGLRLGGYTDLQARHRLSYIFSSPIVRQYWRAASVARSTLVPGTDEFRFAQIADSVCREWEANPGPSVGAVWWAGWGT